MPLSTREILRHLTEEQILTAAQADEYLGFCTACGQEADGVEPDAREYVCERCGARAVGAAELVLMMTY